MTNYVALRGRNEQQSGFPHLSESLEPSDGLNIRVPGLCKRLYVRPGDRTTLVRNPKNQILRKDHYDHKTHWTHPPSKKPKLHTPSQVT